MKDKKSLFDYPKIEIISFDSSDIITASDGNTIYPSFSGEGEWDIFEPSFSGGVKWDIFGDLK